MLRCRRGWSQIALFSFQGYVSGGRWLAPDGVARAEGDSHAMTNKYVTEANTSKWCKLSRESLAVGALARLNNNYHRLHPKARAAAVQFDLAPVCHNPFMNNIA